MQATTNNQETYLPDHVYHALKAKLEKLVSEPFEECGTDPETEIVTALGEIGNIWPLSVLDEAQVAEAA
ncbi:hypothetical protein HW561_04695 [Rhodobacteraceae bacterium B1Z28]|uniref:Uncharacterized protein n=1 Tax=Ruegeria haliotis TaxID=2747601 RepID=A0ABX2PLV8_9RHOB|nr:hypothetical protein [Ruegeria haliotis]NVO55088.1 hypothetical protein [Ruegeria haliotis]